MSISTQDVETMIATVLSDRSLHLTASEQTAIASRFRDELTRIEAPQWVRDIATAGRPKLITDGAAIVRVGVREPAQAMTRFFAQASYSTPRKFQQTVWAQVTRLLNTDLAANYYMVRRVNGQLLVYNGPNQIMFEEAF
jgi:hypothetical protein